MTDFIQIKGVIVDLWQFLGILVSIFASSWTCYLFFYRELQAEIQDIRAETKEFREEMKKSDARWYLLLEKMHMIDKDVEKFRLNFDKKKKD
jgi:hypothetical protein